MARARARAPQPPTASTRHSRRPQQITGREAGCEGKLQGRGGSTKGNGKTAGAAAARRRQRGVNKASRARRTHAFKCPAWSSASSCACCCSCAEERRQAKRAQRGKAASGARRRGAGAATDHAPARRAARRSRACHAPRLVARLHPRPLRQRPVPPCIHGEQLLHAQRLVAAATGRRRRREEERARARGRRGRGGGGGLRRQRRERHARAQNILRP
jgi:hypothetical protein